MFNSINSMQWGWFLVPCIIKTMVQLRPMNTGSTLPPNQAQPDRVTSFFCHHVSFLKIPDSRLFSLSMPNSRVPSPFPKGETTCTLFPWHCTTIARRINHGQDGKYQGHTTAVRKK